MQKLDGRFFTTNNFKNKIINGGFDVNQRDVSGTVSLAAGEYGHDRWKAGDSGCTYTFSTTEGVTTVNITAGSLVQVVEGCNIRTAIYTLSNEGTATGTGGDNLTGGVDTPVEFGIGTLRNVQLEEGSTATEFEQRPLSVEEMLCYRYYYKIHLNGIILDAAFSDLATYCMQIFNLPVKTRIEGTTVTRLLGTRVNIRDDLVQLVLIKDGLRLSVRAATSGRFYYSADSNDWIATDAEL